MKRYSNLRTIVILALVLGMGTTARAQILAPAKWQTNLSEEQIKKGDIVELVFTAQLDYTWQLYGNQQNYEIGPKRAEFEFEPSEGYALIGEPIPVGIKTKYDDIFEVKVNYFEKTAEFRQKVRVLKENATIEGTYSYQVCTTVDGKCILGDEDFEFNIRTTD